VKTEDLARQTVGLLDVAGKSRSRMLSELACLAAQQVRACSGASATVWEDGVPVVTAASHPDVCDLVEAEVVSGRGPSMDALGGRAPSMCQDTLAEGRWPDYTRAALAAGVRSILTVAQPYPAVAVSMSLFGTRPGVLGADQLPLAELLVAFGGAVVGSTGSYGDVQRMALQFRDAAESRALVDQAKGILMHAFGCSAEEAFERMREISQRSDMKVTGVARRVVDSRLAAAD
jgi:hypothetical protein